MDQRPAPLVPAEVDLAGYEFMPLHGDRLFGSDFNARCTDAEWRAGVTLWWKAWKQVPAASLPDDDVALARLAELGRDVKGWRRLRANALSGFVACSDGRLYHPVLSRLAIEAWDRRIKDRERKARWRAGRPGNGDGDGDTARDGDGDNGTRPAGQDGGRGGDVPAEAKRGEARRSEANLEEDAAAAGGSTARDPAAAAARVGIDLVPIRDAIARGDLLELLRGYGADVADGRLIEYTRDADGMRLGAVALVFAWRRSRREAIRHPSGFRTALASWRQLPEDERLAIAEDLGPDLGLPAPRRRTAEIAP